MGNLTKAVVNAKESLLKQVISKKQNELDLLSVSLAKKGQNISTIDKSNLEDLDKDRNNALREYSFSVIDQSQYNQQTLEFATF